MSRAGKRSVKTALISYNAPVVDKDELRSIAAEMFPGEPHAFSLLMRKIQRDFLNGQRSKSCAAGAPRNVVALARVRDA